MALGLLKAGRAPHEVLAALAPQEQTELVERCFAARLLDEPVFELVRATVPKAKEVTFSAVTAHPAVNPIPDREGTYVTERTERDERMRSWLEPDRRAPPWLVELNAALAKCHRSRTPPDEVEEAFHLLASKPDAGIDLLRSLFEAADGAYQLARCRDLIEVADERMLLCGPVLAVERNWMQRRHDTRLMWSAEYERTERFTLPEASRRQLDALVAGDLHVLRIFGPSGAGKTALLDWLISRRCVPEGFACARIDFTRVDPLIATKEPWLVLLELAHQLDRQLPESPLLDLLLDHGSHRERLVGARGGDTAALGHLAAAAPGERELTADDVRHRFVEALATPLCPPLLLAFDALETALLADVTTATHAGVAALVDELSKVLEGVPQARLVLVCHTNVAGETEEVTAPLGGDRVEIGGLTEDEAHRYLVEEWGLGQPDTVLRAAASALNTRPADLSRVAATLADADPPTPPDELADPAAWYVNDRLDRITDPAVRWLVRHGVLARRLDFDFVADVLAGPLADAVPISTQSAKDLKPLWAGVRRQAALVSWADVDTAGRVTFHERMASPLRRLLRDEPAFESLQQAAAEHFERRAAADSARWSDWMAEALYHRCELDPDEAVHAWRTALQKAKRRETRHVVRLCVELLELVGTSAQPDAAVVKEAWLEFAWANVRLARETPGAPPGHDGWARAAEGLAAAERQPTTSEQPGKTALVRAALLQREGAFPQAAEVLDTALRRDLTDRQRLRIAAEHADVLVEIDWREALPQYRSALALAEDMDDPVPEPPAILRRMAVTLARWDRYPEALAACEEGLGKADPESLSHAELCLLYAKLHIRTGQPSAVFDLVEPAERHGGAAAHGAALMKARAALAAWDPGRAVSVLVEELPPERSGAASVEAEIRWAELHEVLGFAYSHLLETAAALEHLEQAALLWSAAGFATGTARCHTLVAELQLRGLGDVRGAGLTLKRAAHAEPPAASGEARWLRLRKAEWADRASWDEEAHQLVDSVIEDLQAAGAPAHDLVRAAVEGLALATRPEPERFLRTLVTQLGEVQGAAARLTLLDSLWRCPTVRDVDSGLLRRFEQALQLPPAEDLERLSRRDRGLLTLRHAEVARVCRHRRDARRRLTAAQDLLGGDAGIYAVRRVHAAEGRVEDDRLARHLTDPALTTTSDDHPLLKAALALEHAERVIQRRALLPGQKRQRSRVSAALALARTVLSEGAGPEGRWAALLHDLSARVEAADAAKDHRRQAERIHDRLAAKVGPGDDGEPSVTRIGLEWDGEELLVRIRTPDGSEESQILDPERDPLARLAGAGRYGVDAYHRLARAFPRDWPEFAAQAAAVLLPPSLRTAGSAEAPLTLRLEVDDPALAALPWELAVRQARAEGADGVGILYRAPSGAIASRAATARSGSTVLRVLVLRPSREAQRRAVRGAAATASLSIADAYRLQGPVDLSMLDTASLTKLRDALERLEPDVLHIAAPLAASGGAPAVDLSADDPSSVESKRLTTTGLERLLSAPGGRTPLIVLEPPGPPRTSELVHQLLLRNAFAAEVLELTGGEPLIATGLVRYAEQDRLYQTLRTALDEAGTPRTVAERLRALAEPAGAEDPLGFAAAALFAGRPDAPLPGPEAV
jgi:hypothetical protein